MSCSSCALQATCEQEWQPFLEPQPCACWGPAHPHRRAALVPAAAFPKPALKQQLLPAPGCCCQSQCWCWGAAPRRSVLPLVFLHEWFIFWARVLLQASRTASVPVPGSSTTHYRYCAAVGIRKILLSSCSTSALLKLHSLPLLRLNPWVGLVEHYSWMWKNCLPFLPPLRFAPWLRAVWNAYPKEVMGTLRNVNLKIVFPAQLHLLLKKGQNSYMWPWLSIPFIISHMSALTSL